MSVNLFCADTYTSWARTCASLPAIGSPVMAKVRRIGAQAGLSGCMSKEEDGRRE